jgi:hypothetical protein
MATKRVQGQLEMQAAVKALRQAAIVANSAADTLERRVRKNNPDRFLRRWTAEQTTKNMRNVVKGTDALAFAERERARARSEKGTSK